MKEREGREGNRGDSAVESGLLSKGGEEELILASGEKEDFHQAWQILWRLAKFIKISYAEKG